MEKDHWQRALKWIPTSREGKDITHMYKPTILDKILDRKNLNNACKQVLKNKGAAGVDKMTVEELKGYLATNREKIIQEIRERRYKPQPVLRVYMLT